VNYSIWWKTGCRSYNAKGCSNHQEISIIRIKIDHWEINDYLKLYKPIRYPKRLRNSSEYKIENYKIVETNIKLTGLINFERYLKRKESHIAVRMNMVDLASELQWVTAISCTSEPKRWQWNVYYRTHRSFQRSNWYLPGKQRHPDWEVCKEILLLSEAHWTWADAGHELKWAVDWYCTLELKCRWWAAHASAFSNARSVKARGVL